MVAFASRVLRFFIVACFVLPCWVQPAAASIEIFGALSNFDVYNRTGDSCDGFEIELYGVDASDVFHTYWNPLWQQPQITTVTEPTPFVRVLYDGRTLGSRVVPDEIQHFGVSLRRQATQINYNWLVNSGGTLVRAPATPTPDPVLLPTLPTPSWSELDGQLLTEIRNDNDYPIWLKARRSVNDDVLELEDLLRSDPSTAGLVDAADAAEAFLLDPGDALTEAEDLIDASGPGGIAIFRVFQYTGEVDDSNNALGPVDFDTMHGEEVGIVMTAVNLVPEPAAAMMLAMGAAGLLLGRRR